VTALLLNIAVLVFLIVTIYMCYRLNNRIQALQDSRSELAEIITEFDVTTKRATSSIAELHAATERIAENMQHRVDKANFVADDLQFLIERANKTIKQLDSGKPQARSASARRGSKPTAASPRRRSRAEEELTQLVKRKEGDAS
jgi:uncharacterized protein YoxC